MAKCLIFLMKKSQNSRSTKNTPKTPQFHVLSVCQDVCYNYNAPDKDGRTKTNVHLRAGGRLIFWRCAAVPPCGGAQANYPAKYAVKCLMSWGDAGLRTVEELEVYERYSELARTARPDISQGAREKLGAFLREIKNKHRMVEV